MSKGQTAFEYLLIIGGTILVAALVLVVVQGNLSTANVAVNESVQVYAKSARDLGQATSLPVPSPSLYPSASATPTSIPVG